MVNQDADMAKYLIALSRRELVQHPRSAAIVTDQTAKDIDLSGIFRMTPAEVEEAVRSWGAAA